MILKTLFLNTLNYIQTKLPTVFVLEDETGLVKIDRGRDFNKMLKLRRQVKFHEKNRLTSSSTV